MVTYYLNVWEVINYLKMVRDGTRGLADTVIHKIYSLPMRLLSSQDLSFSLQICKRPVNNKLAK